MGVALVLCAGVVGGGDLEAGVISGHESSRTQGCPYSWMGTASCQAVMFSITAVARWSGSRAASPAPLGCPGPRQGSRRSICRGTHREGGLPPPLANPGASQPNPGPRKITRNLTLDLATFSWTGQL